MLLLVFFASIALTSHAANANMLNTKIKTWERLTHDWEVSNYTDLAQFIRQNPDWPSMRALKDKAERAMPNDSTPAEVIAWYDDYPPKTAKGLDQYLYALLSTGRKDQAQKLIREWWGDIRLTRDEQKYIYQKYGRMIDRDAHTRRLDTLLFSKQYTNARAIADVLDNGFPALAEARIALAAEKPEANALLAKVPASLQNDPGLLYERLHWRRENKLNAGAVEILNRAPPADKIQNPKDWWQERHIIIRRLIEEKKYKGAYILASQHRQTEGFSYAQAEWVAGWLALEFVGEPRKAYDHFRNLYSKVETPVSKARGAYWAGRAAEKLGNKKVADQSYAIAAKFQTVYYGQLAGAKLGIEEALPHAAPPTLTAVDIKQFENNELIRVAQYYHNQNKKEQASTFLRAFINQNETPKAYRFAAERAATMQRYYDAVKISKDATNKGLFLTAQSYPVITDQLVHVNTVEWALIHGIIRQESLFDTNAKSAVGARGLMQLMPATAAETASKLGVSHNAGWLTSRPSHNIMLGSAYLDQMLRRFGGSYPLAIAAYNAGPGRVDQWLKTYGDPRKGEIDWIDWIELIPIYETRNYVQRVMESIYVYRLRLKDIQAPSESRIHIALAR